MQHIDKPIFIQKYSSFWGLDFDKWIVFLIRNKISLIDKLYIDCTLRIK